jgi:hypothetical protein
MPGFDHSVLTDVGWDALTDAEAGQAIAYTKMEAGDGNIYGGDEEMYGMTALVHKMADVPITNFTNDGNGQITLVGVISSKNVTTGFYLREIGVKATIDGGPELLYSVAYAGTGGDYIPSSAETEVVIQSIQIIIKIDRAPNVSVVVQPGLDVTCQNIGPGTVGPGWFRDKIGQICWFKRINSPKQTLELIETPDLISIDIPFIDENLNMYVALNNPDIFPHFSTIQNALNYLVPKTIKPGITVTITVSAGTWNTNPTTTVNHPQGSQIKIIGTADPVKNVGTVTGGAADVRLNGPAGRFAGMAVGDYFLYKNQAHWYGMAISGVRKVKAKAADDSWISFDPFWWGTFPPLGGVSGGTVTPIKTVHKTATNVPFMVVKGNGLGLLRNMVWVGSGRPQNISWEGVYGFVALAGITRMEQCGAFQWYGDPISRITGIGSWKGGILECFDCSANECGVGFGASGMGSHANLNDCAANSCEYAGIWSTAGQMYILGSSSCGCDIGIESSENSNVFFGGHIASYNRSYGFLTVLNAYSSGGEPSCHFYSNGTRDINTLISSTLARTDGPYLSFGTTNVAPYSLSADGCYFSP